MPIQYRNAGFISATYQPLKVADAPTIGTATREGDTSASVTFTAPGNVGGSAITAYYAVSSPGQVTATAASSPITVTGLENGTTYTFSVWALNSYGPSSYSGASNSVNTGVTGIFAGGTAGSTTNTINYIIIPTVGNSQDFGDLTVAVYGPAGCASSSRGIIGGGYVTNVINYFSFSNTGNATDFGDLTLARGRLGSCSSSTRGVFGGGLTDPTIVSNVIDYITIATVGNATDFGDLSSARGEFSSCSSSTRGLFAGGATVIGPPRTYTNTIDYITIATTGNTTDFGDLPNTSLAAFAACSSSTRGIFGGGNNLTERTNVISYVTIASTGNTTDFGDLTLVRNQLAGCSSSTRGVFGGGSTGTNSNVIDYVTIATIGNATDFGDLIPATTDIGACSNGHGGLS